jgi:hypothetical protein
MAFVHTSLACVSKGSLRIIATSLAGLALAFPGAAQAATIFVGSWVNTTFNSTGAASFTVDISGADVSFTVDLDGFVFGGADPGALTLTGTIAGDTATLTALDHPTYGDASGTFNLVTGAIEAQMTDLPNPSIDRVSITGTGSPSAIALDYVVCFVPACTAPAIERAVGVIDATVIPLPATAWLFAAGLAGAAVRLRRRPRS